MSCVRLPFLSGLPAIFQVFVAFLTSFPQVGHFAMVIPDLECYHMDQHKTLAVNIRKKSQKKAFLWSKNGKTDIFN